LKVTSPATYRRSISAKEIPFALPSILENGKHPVFILKPPDIPEFLKLFKALNIELNIPTEEDLAKNTIDEIKDRMQKQLEEINILENLDVIVDTMVINCVVRPKVVRSNPKKDELAVSEIVFEDKMAIFEKIWSLSPLSKEEESKRKSFQQ